MLKPGDTFIDFACGQNTFGSMLIDPGTGGPLATRAFDVLAPGENSYDFQRRNWFSVDATELPAGELIIGLNPPFGHQNHEAIKFVEHAICARPRLIVLIMPATNYSPPGYDLILRDDQVCRGSVFYTPGSKVRGSSTHDTPIPCPTLWLSRVAVPHATVVALDQCQSGVPTLPHLP